MMRRCASCLDKKIDCNFEDGSLICKKCIFDMENEFHIEYSPPRRVSKIEAIADLINAIRKQAIVDKKLKEFEKFWINNPRCSEIWKNIKENMNNKDLDNFQKLG